MGQRANRLMWELAIRYGKEIKIIDCCQGKNTEMILYKFMGKKYFAGERECGETEEKPPSRIS